MKTTTRFNRNVMRVRPLPAAGLIATTWLLLLVSPVNVTGQTFPAETAWTPVQSAGAALQDAEGDSGTKTERDIVGNASSPAGFTYADSGFIYFRLRLNANPSVTATDLRPFNWGVIFDTDSNWDQYELLLIVDGTSDVVQLKKNTITASLNSPADAAESTLNTYPVRSHARVVRANSNYAGNADFFLDWAVPRADLAAAGVSETIAVRLIFGVSSSSGSLNGDVAGGTAGSSVQSSAVGSDQVKFPTP